MELTKENLEKILKYDPETGLFTRLVCLGGKRAGLIAGFKMNSGYWVIGVGGRYYMAHKLAFIIMGYEMPKEVDHINRIKDDNRFINLRIASRAQNCMNQKARSTNKCGLRGVSWHKKSNRYVAQINQPIGNGKAKRLHLGCFFTKEEASDAYRKKVIELYGEEWLPKNH